MFPFSGHLSRKFPWQHWLQLLAITFCRQAKIRLLDKHMYTFENPASVLEALSVVHDWSCTNLGDRPLRITVWQDRKAILDHLTQSQSKHSHGKIVANAADLLSYSAMARYLVREYGQEEIFKQRPAVGKAMHLAKSPDAPWNNNMFLLFTRASNKHPILHDVLHLCLTDLLH